MKVGTLAKWTVVATMVLIAGCASYYKVTDPASGRSFYTEKVNRPKDGTTIMFKDAKSGAEVTLQSSEVLQISSDEFKKATGK